MQLTLVRHTTPAVGPGVCYGQSDVGLTSNFMAEVSIVRAALVERVFDACYTSPLQRCSQLADALDLGQPQHDCRLMELNFGAWEMRPWNDIPRTELDAWAESYVAHAPPDGESFSDLHRRVTGFLRELKAAYIGRSVVAVTHAGVIRALLAEALEIPLAETFDIHLAYGGVTNLVFETGTCGMDDTSL